MSEKMGNPEDYGVPELFGIPVSFAERTEREMEVRLSFPWYMMPHKIDPERLQKARKKLFRDMRRINFEMKVTWLKFKIHWLFRRFVQRFHIKDGDHE